MAGFGTVSADAVSDGMGGAAWLSDFIHTLCSVFCVAEETAEKGVCGGKSWLRNIVMLPI